MASDRRVACPQARLTGLRTAPLCRTGPSRHARPLPHNAHMLPCYVLLDLETTGANPVRDRITEIAAVRIEHGREVARLDTLVDPACRIPPFIQQLTGIDDAMVAAAPRLPEVLPRLLELLEGAVLVAHNVRFDHGFLKNAAAREGVDLRVRTLCTVRMSRRLYPQARGHGLDAIMRRHGLATASRHRAMGDVLLLQAWLDAVRTERGAEALQDAAAALLGEAPSLPSLLQTPIEHLPSGCGVYLMWGEGRIPLYIGKSVSLRRRVMSHFQADHRAAREMRLAQEVRRIECVETAGEFGALLLEARLVKELQPVLNRQLRRERQLCSWHLADDPVQWPLLSLVGGEALRPRDFDRLYGAYRSKRQAIEALRQLADAHRLCPRALGLESGKGRCFAHQLGRCAGVCCGGESPEHHHLRLSMALAAQRLRHWPYPGPVGVREWNPASARGELHVFDQWSHLGTALDEAEIDAILQDRDARAVFDLDTYRLLLGYLGGSSRHRTEHVDLSARMRALRGAHAP